MGELDGVIEAVLEEDGDGAGGRRATRFAGPLTSISPKTSHHSKSPPLKKLKTSPVDLKGKGRAQEDTEDSEDDDEKVATAQSRNRSKGGKK